MTAPNVAAGSGKPPGDVNSLDREALDRAALHGAAWTGASRSLTQAASWAATILVARLLTPHDYGLTTMAGVFLGMVSVLGEFGIGSTILSRRDLTAEQIRQLNAISIALGLGSFVVAVLCAWPLGLFFRSNELPAVVIALSTTFFINSVQVVPAALLRRELAFRRLALIDLARGAVVPFASLVLAALGLRYWALVGAAILGAAISTVATARSRRVGFARPRWDGLREEMMFGRDVLISRVAYVFYTESDFTVAGRRLGPQALGAYSLAWTLANSPIEKITQLLSDVAPAVFSAAQQDRTALRRYYLNATEVLAFVTLPISLGMCLVSRDFVAVALGPRWSTAAVPLAILAGYAGFRSLVALNGHLFLVTGQLRFGMWLMVWSAVSLPVAFLFASRWGPVGIASAWLAVHPITSGIALARVRRELDMTVKQYVRALRLGLDGSLAMLAVVLTLRGWSHQLSAPARLLLEIVCGAASFIAVTLVLHGKRLSSIREWLVRTRRLA